MKKLSFVLLWVLSVVFVNAQNNGFNYKAQISDNGNVVANQNVDVRFTILENGTTIVYQETQSTTTNSSGIFAVNIGEGTVESGDFSTINWANEQFLKVEINTGNGFTDFGTTLFRPVPTAKYADRAGNVFSGSWNDLSDIPSDIADGDDDTHLTEAEVDNYVSNNGYLTSEVDGSVTNELQSLSINNDQLSISQGNSVTIPVGATKLDELTDAKTNTNESSIFIGESAGENDNLGDNYNIGIGYQTLFSNTTGKSNIATGYQALYNNTIGKANVAIGVAALYNNTYEKGLVAIGDSALFNNGVGADSVFSEGIGNTAIGYGSLLSNTVGYRNTATGYQALYSNIGGNDNIAYGYRAMQNNVHGHSNVALGVYTLSRNTNGYRNVAIGEMTMYNNSSGAENTAIGNEALWRNSTGNGNTAIGNQALYHLGTGSENTAIGAHAGGSVYVGSDNIFIGYSAGFNETGSNKLYIDPSATYSPLIYGDFSTDELTINGQLEVTEKLVASTSGDADMKAYVYGFVGYNGTNYTDRSSDGYTVTKISTGVYKITLTDVATDDYHYVVCVTSEIGGGGTPVFAATDYVGTSGHQNEFYIKTYDLSGNLVDNSFHFVVYKK